MAPGRFGTHTRRVAREGRRRSRKGGTIYPVLFRIGDFEVTSFGLLVAVAAVVGLWLFERERRLSGLPDGTVDAAMAGVVGGLAGAKVVWAVEHMGQAGSFLDLLLSRGGLSWFGGFAGGFLAGVSILRRRRLPILRVLAAATPALALAHAIGRVGCFLVGDDSGTPSNLPWAVAFPEGLPPTSLRVHPTQLYETAALLPFVWLLLRWRRQQRPDRFVLGAYFVFTGAARFGIEFLRIREPLFGPIAVAHVFSMVAICVGVALLYSSYRSPLVSHA
ncbi:MAG: prolipoprotein diacylglyceryl transferase family protein [Vicinamibacterales bacterium]|jgi:phosphatidylglycerol:prolipoprotein diacylglycerol transferase